MNTVESAIAYARERRDAILSEYRELVAIPSVSTQQEHEPDMRKNAQWLADALTALGMTRADIMETGGHPVVYGEWLGAPGKPVVLVYGHYDVQPVDPLVEWDTDPFGGEIKGDYIYGRGVSDMKGQLFAQLKAMEALKNQGDYPVNIKYLLEGEEEVGSPNLGGFISANKDLLACDVVLNCDSEIQAKDVPSIVYSLRGLAYFEIEVRGPSHDLHSGLFGGSVPNPIHVLSELIAGMHDKDGRVTLPGFYDSVRELGAEERALLAEFPHSDDEWLAMAGASALYGEAGYTTVERTGARPALDVNGIWGGYIEPGAKTVLPAKATAKLSARLVADQKPEDIRPQLETYLQQHAPKYVEWTLREHVHGPGAIMDRKSPYMKAALNALETVFDAKPIFKRQGGSVPVVGIMQELLGADSIMLGFALPDDGIHGPNERQYLPNFFKGIETYIHFLADL